MPALFLTEADVTRLIDMPATLGIVETALRELAAGKATNVPRHRAQAPGVILHAMHAAAEYLGTSGWKAYTTTKQGAKFHVGLYDNASGEMLALIEADQLGRLRTGAVTGIAAKYLARAGADRVGLFGTGTQARTQLAALAAALRPQSPLSPGGRGAGGEGGLKQVLVYGRNAERRNKFCAEMSQRTGVAVEPADESSAAVRDLPIVVTATTSRTPVFNGDDVMPSTLVCAVGSNWLNKAEIDVRTVERSARIVCDDVAACKHEAGDLVPAVEAGAFRWNDAVALGDVIAGRALGRTAEEEIVVFKSVGLAIEDVAMATEIVKRAKQQGVGTPLPF